MSAGGQPWLVPAAWCAGVVPTVALIVDGVNGRLGANPTEVALNTLGKLALIWLVASLACTPIKLLFGWAWPIRIRRALGVTAFYFASAHVLVYVVLDQRLHWGALLDDVLERPFITVGFGAWVSLLPLALTSTDAAVHALGPTRWKRLHRLAYVCGVLGVVHFLWRVKKDKTEPFIYAGVLAVLLLVRVLRRHVGKSTLVGPV